MNATCQPLPPSVAQEMLQLVARNICDIPGDNAAQRDSRTRQMVYTTLGFEPRDGLEYMLASLSFGHFHLILDSMRDALRGQMDEIKGRTKTTMVSMDRAMLGMLKEMRVAQRRPLAPWARATQQEPIAAGPAMDWVAEWSGMPEQPIAAAADSPLAPDQPTAPEAEPPIAIAPAEATMTAPPGTAPLATQTARPAPITTPLAVASPGPVSANARAPARPVAPQPGPQASTAARPAHAGGGAPPLSPSDIDDDATIEQHIADFQEAFAAMAETLAEARALEVVTPEPVAATGD